MMSKVDDVLKVSLDVGAGSLLMLATAPLQAAAAAAVWISMGRPIFFRQQRPGRNGRPFRLCKFRTMREPSEWEERITTDAMRLTPIGKILRATSLDELPTLWNVLSGEMSLVGPRPLLMRYLVRYTPEQARRHDVKPGITGWAQINGRNEIDWEKKLDLDVWYVHNRSILLDLKILILTVWKVVRREGISQEGEATASEFMGTIGDARRAAE